MEIPKPCRAWGLEGGRREGLRPGDMTGIPGTRAMKASVTKNATVRLTFKGSENPLWAWQTLPRVQKVRVWVRKEIHQAGSSLDPLACPRYPEPSRP